MIHLAIEDLCTGCGACASICSKKCISMLPNTIGIVLPKIDHDKCIECHLCEKICPVLNHPNSHQPIKVYASWSKDEKQRMNSASGGIAYELYKYAISKGFKVVGASINDDFTVSLKVASKEQEIIPFQNSKYVFSDATSCYPLIDNGIKQGDSYLIMGLPCQIAAFKNLFKNNKHIIFVEILCHGISPYLYLKQHIQKIEKETQKKATNLSFRDPSFNTSSYTFTLYDEKGCCFYSGKIKDGDSYQFGYHRSISYRENCYHCNFAKKERVGDIVLCDYYGLGKRYSCNYTKENVSCVLIVTEKGEAFFENIKNTLVFAEERPIVEAEEGNPRLSHPCPKPKERIKFESKIIETNGDFEKAIQPLLLKYLKEEQAPLFIKRIRALQNRLKKIFHL